MPTISDFTAIEHCSVLLNNIRASYYNFNDDTATGESDFTVNETYGTVDVTSNAGKMTIYADGTADTWSALSPNNGDGPAAWLPDITGDHTVETYLTSNIVGVAKRVVALLYREDANNFAGIFFVNNNGSYTVTVGKYVFGSWNGDGDIIINSTDLDGTVGLRYSRSGNTFTWQYKRGADANWQTVGSTTTYAGMSGGPALYVGSFTGVTCTAQFDSLKITSGSTYTSKTIIRDNDTGNNRYIDAGVGNTIDWSTFNHTTNNITVTYNIKGSNSCPP